MTDFSDYSISQIVAIYNNAQFLLGRDTVLKTFRDKPTAIARVETAEVELRAMHGQATLLEDLNWDIKTRTPDTARVHSTLDLTKKIRVLAPANPKRANTKAWELFSYYKDGMIGDDYVAHLTKVGHSRRLALSCLHWDIDHGFLILE